MVIFFQAVDLTLMGRGGKSHCKYICRAMRGILVGHFAIDCTSLLPVNRVRWRTVLTSFSSPEMHRIQSRAQSSRQGPAKISLKDLYHKAQGPAETRKSVPEAGRLRWKPGDDVQDEDEG